MTDPTPGGRTYEPVPYWGKIPHGMTFKCNATSVAVDSGDNVYVFNRGSHPLMVFDRDGDMIDAWDRVEEFGRPHGIFIDDEDWLYLVDDGAHFIEKRSRQGERAFTLGQRGKPAPWLSGEIFNRPTDVAAHPLTGELFVSDGYGNCRVHRFSPSGEHLQSWGEPGTDPGQFSLPHGIAVTPDDRVLVCDRENFRVQVFSTAGKFIEQWWFHRPFCIRVSRGADPLIYVGECRSDIPNRKGVPGLGSCVKVLDSDGTQVARFGDALPGLAPDQFIAPHGIAVDSRGDVYVAEVSNTWVLEYDGPPPLGDWVTLRKWRLVDDGA